MQVNSPYISPYCVRYAITGGHPYPYSSQSSVYSDENYSIECTPIENESSSSEEGSELDGRQNTNPSEFFTQRRINMLSMGDQASFGSVLVAHENRDGGERSLKKIGTWPHYSESKPLYTAIKTESIFIVEKLLMKYVGFNKYEELFKAYFKFDENPKTQIKNIALHCAVHNKDYEAIKILFNNGAQVNGCHASDGIILHTVLQGGDLDIINIFLQKYTDQKIQFEISVEVPYAKKAYPKILENALLYAVQHNDVATLKLLLTPHEKQESNIREIRKPSSHMLFNVLTKLSQDIEIKDSETIKILSACLINALKEEKKSYFNKENFGEIKKDIKFKNPIFARVVQRVAASELFPRGLVWLGRICIGFWAAI